MLQNLPYLASVVPATNNMAIWVVEFSNGGIHYQKEFCLGINIPKRKLMNFEFWINGDMSNSAKI